MITRTLTVTMTIEQQERLREILADAVDSADDEGYTGEVVDLLRGLTSS